MQFMDDGPVVISMADTKTRTGTSKTGTSELQCGREQYPKSTKSKWEQIIVEGYKSTLVQDNRQAFRRNARIRDKNQEVV
jgi:hypothetical protein